MKMQLKSNSVWADLKLQAITVTLQGLVISATVAFSILLNAWISHQHLYLLQNTMNLKLIQEQGIHLMELIYKRAHISINITEPKIMQLSEQDMRSSVPIQRVPMPSPLLTTHWYHIILYNTQYNIIYKLILQTKYNTLKHLY